MVQMLNHFAPTGKSLIEIRHLHEACLGSTAVMQATLDRLNIPDMNNGNIYHMPLCVAVHSSNTAAVVSSSTQAQKSMLQLGAVS